MLLKTIQSPIKIVVFLILLVICNSEFLTAENAKLKIGIIAPITDGVAAWGTSVKSAIELANQHSEEPAELFVADEETCVNSKALDAFNYLLSVKKVDLLITSCLGGAQAIAPLVDDILELKELEI